MRILLPILFFVSLFLTSSAEELSEDAIRRALPAYEAYVQKAQRDWEVPQVAVAVVYQDEILWWKGYGEKEPDQETVFAIGSATKAFAAATLAMMVDGGGPGWDARVVDHLPEFAMFDSWVTREVQVKDLLAQHLGLTQQALSSLGAIGYSAERIKGALRWVEPVTSFRSSYAYLNTPHMVAGDLVANWAGAPTWEDALESRILSPLGMTTTTWTPEGLDKNPNRAVGHARVDGEVVPITAGAFPYVFGPAGALNSNLHDMSRWVRLQLGDGEFEGKRIVSQENLQVTRTPQTPLGDNAFYCMGWVRVFLSGQPVVWHNGGTPGHTTFVGLQPDHDLGLVVLSNLGGTQMPDAVGLKFFEMVHGIDGPDYSAQYLARRHEPKLKPIIKMGDLEGLVGDYHHPALGTVTVGAGPTVEFLETGLKAALEPIGPNLFRIRARQGWLKEIGWDVVGEALYTPAGLSEESSLTVYLGEENEGSKFRLARKH
jgi:CubicO group peptidase (beta-lactamase class C family)